MNTESRLTIAIPVFERYEYFERCLRSALAQTFACQVLVVDNGSVNEKFEIEARRHGCRVRYIRQPKNLGMFANWNTCREQAETEFLMILGDDDLVHPEFSERFHQALNEYKKLDIYCSDFYYLHESSGHIQQGDFPMPNGYISGMDLLAFTARNGLGLPTIAMAYRIKNMKPYYSALTASNDWFALYQNIDQLNIYCDSARLVAYRKHAMSDSVNNSIRNLLSHAAIYLCIADQLACRGRWETELAKHRALDEISWIYGKSSEAMRKKIISYYAEDEESPYLKIINDFGLSLLSDVGKMNFRFYLKTKPKKIIKRLVMGRPCLTKPLNWIAISNF